MPLPHACHISILVLNKTAISYIGFSICQCPTFLLMVTRLNILCTEKAKHEESSFSRIPLVGHDRINNDNKKLGLESLLESPTLFGFFVFGNWPRARNVRGH